jgi:GNAT superfamily N-acetyltransferase
LINLREETAFDIEAREDLLDLCFGPARFQKTCERLREGRLPAAGLSLVVEQDGLLIGTVRLWHVTAGPNRPALMLGPVAVDPSRQSLGVGSKLIGTALQRSCWWAMRRITSDSASRPRRLRTFGCLGPTSAAASSVWSLRRVRSRERKDWCQRPAPWGRSRIGRPSWPPLWPSACARRLDR